MFSSNYIEICAGSAEDILTACRFPIDRIELNSALELGGLTPSVGELRFAKSVTDLPIMCMVRPRSAGFVYSETEFTVMKHDARILIENGADGIVFGFLRPNHTIDEQRTKTLSDFAHAAGKEAVFHRAFDLVTDPFSACETLISCGIDRLLTSGLEETALQGAGLIKQLIDTFEPKLSILPGAGINAETIVPLKQAAGASQFHMTAKSMRRDHSEYPAVDARNIQAVMTALHAADHHTGQSILTREDFEMMEQELYEDSLTEQ